MKAAAAAFIACFSKINTRPKAVHNHKTRQIIRIKTGGSNRMQMKLKSATHKVTNTNNTEWSHSSSKAMVKGQLWKVKSGTKKVCFWKLSQTSTAEWYQVQQSYRGLMSFYKVPLCRGETEREFLGYFGRNYTLSTTLSEVSHQMKLPITLPEWLEKSPFLLIVP